MHDLLYIITSMPKYKIFFLMHDLKNNFLFGSDRHKKFLPLDLPIADYVEVW